MKQKIYQVLLICLFGLFLFGVCGCSPIAANDFIASLDSETENEYTFVGTSGIAIKGKSYDYLTCARELVPWNQEHSQGIVLNVYSLSDKVVFTYTYDLTKVDASGNQYYYKHDIGLFSLDYTTGQCELIKDLRDVYSESMFSAYPNILKNVVDNQYGILIYNGVLEIFDFANKTTTYSKEIYDKTQVALSTNYDLIRTVYSNFLGNDYYQYVVTTQTLSYFSYELGSYVYKEFSNFEFINSFDYLSDGQFARIGDMIVSFTDIMPARQYGSVVYLGSEQDISLDELNALTDQYVEEKTAQSQYAFLSVDEKTYQQFSYERNKLVDIETEEIITFDHAFFASKSQVFNSVEDYWKENIWTSAKINEFEVISAYQDWLIVGCQESFALRLSVPLLLFEVDLKSDAVLYIGCPQIGDIIKVL